MNLRGRLKELNFANRLWEALYPSQLSEYRVDFAKENYRSLVILLISGLFISVAILLIQLFLGPLEDSGHVVEMLGFFLFSGAMFVSYRKEARENATKALYIWVGLLLVWAIIVSTSFEPDKETFIFVMLITILPLLIRDAWGRIISFVLIATLAYLILDGYVKSPEIFREDLIHVIVADLSCIVFSKRLISDRLNNLETSNSAETKAEHDGLTGIYNRRGGESLIAEHLSNGVAGSFMIMDVDDFKHVNDHYGHAAGDEVLKKVARTLSAHFRESDVVMRMGGDEFIVYAIGMVDIHNVENKLISLCEDMRKIVLDEETGDHISVSIGCAVNLGSYPDYESLSAEADKLLYITKGEGKDGYRVTDKDHKKG